MKICIVGRGDGWMGTHLSHFSDGFRSLGHEVLLADYRLWDKRGFDISALINPVSARIRRQTMQLKRLLAESKPHVLIVIPARPIFDYDSIRESFPGKIIFYDMDGPASSCFENGLEWIRKVDLLLSVSPVMAKRLVRSGFDNVEYLAHGVDTNYYSPVSPSPEEKVRFGSPVAFVGRPSERRAEYLEAVADLGLTVWGKRWAKKPYSSNPVISSCRKEKVNILSEDLIKLYRSTVVMTNILREPLMDIMNLQVFSIPATGTCLVTEWVEDIEDSFDLGNEILTFKTVDDFRETVAMLVKDTMRAKKIGESGMKRCIAHHTHAHRARTILGMLDKR
jgi:hypothetical protein